MSNEEIMIVTGQKSLSSVQRYIRTTDNHLKRKWSVNNPIAIPTRTVKRELTRATPNTDHTAKVSQHLWTVL